MSLHDEKAAALAEVLAATGEEIVWKGRTLNALVSDIRDHELKTCATPCRRSIVKNSGYAANPIATATRIGTFQRVRQHEMRKWKNFLATAS